MGDTPDLVAYPAMHQCPNSLFRSLHQGMECLGIACDMPHLLAATGLGFGVVAAEEWCDPATLLWHPMQMTTPVIPLVRLLGRALHRMSLLGVVCEQAWFDRETLPALPAFVASPQHADGVLIVWGCGAPGYTVVEWHNDRFVCDSGTFTPTQLDLRGGVHCIVLRRELQAPAHGMQWHDMVSPLMMRLRVDFATPNHPLRSYQTWHCGIDAWHLLAATARQAAPLSLISTHVARIISDYTWRLMQMREAVNRWSAPTEPHDAQMYLATALDDCCFYAGVLYKQYGQRTLERALTTSDGALIASACTDIATTLRDVSQRIGMISDVWWAEQDSNL